MRAQTHNPTGKGKRRGNAAPGAPRRHEVDCLVGGIVVTYQEIAGRVKRCTEGRQEWYSMVYPQIKPHTIEQKMRSSEARRQKGTYPRLRHLPGADEKSLNLERLGSMWGEMRKANPGAISGDSLVGRVKYASKHRNGVAHARRTRSNATVRNDRWHVTYEVGTLEGYLGRMQETLDHVNQLYSHLRLVPME